MNARDRTLVSLQRRGQGWRRGRRKGSEMDLERNRELQDGDVSQARKRVHNNIIIKFSLSDPVPVSERRFTTDGVCNDGGVCPLRRERGQDLH